MSVRPVSALPLGDVVGRESAPVGPSGAPPDPSPPPLAPPPRAWKPPPAAATSAAGFLHGLSAAFREHPRAVAAVLAGVSAIGAPAAHATVDTPLSPPAADPAARDLAHDVLFAPEHRPAASASTPPRASPTTAPTYAVDTTTTAQIDTLQRSSDAADRRLAATLRNARTAYAVLIASGARVLVTRAAGNGGQRVLIIVPAGFDATQPARVHTHYHGWNATVAEPLGHSAGTGARIRALQARDPQLVFVLPEASNAPARRGSYPTDWSNVRSQAATTDAALAAAGVDQVALRVVSAHSGGGAALARAIEATPHGAGLRADRLELLDSLYGSEAAVAAWAQTAPGHAVARVTYYRGTNVGGRDATLATAFGARYQRIDMARQGPITEAENPTLRDARGRTVGRTFAPDAHNRTVGSFMGASAP